MLHKTWMWTYFLGIMVAALLRATALHAGPPVVGEIACPATASYRIGAGPRVSPPKGIYPLVLPVEIWTHRDPCRVLIPGQCLIEAGANCALRFSKGPAGEFLLRLDQGAAIYLVETSATLKLQATAQGPWGLIGGAVARQPSRHLGMVKVSPTGQTQWVNLQGDLKVGAEKTPAQPVPVMQRLCLGPGRVAEIAPLRAAGDIREQAKLPPAGDRLPLTLESWEVTGTTPPSLQAPAMAKVQGCTPRHPHDVGPLAPNHLDENR